MMYIVRSRKESVPKHYYLNCDRGTPKFTRSKQQAAKISLADLDLVVKHLNMLLPVPELFSFERC